MHSFYSNNLFQYFVDLRQKYNAHERCTMTSEVNKSSKAKKRKEKLRRQQNTPSRANGLISNAVRPALRPLVLGQM